ARGLGTIRLRLDLHARRRCADAACRQHALPLDLHHADAAIAVGAVAGLWQVAQMRQLDAETARSAGNRLVRANVDLATVDAEGIGLAARVHAHGSTQTRMVVPVRGPPRRLRRRDPVAGTHRATHAGFWNTGSRPCGNDT